ncbi:MAG: DUF4212 domain-containing protein [Nitratireductor sp.]|nr:DUF4212 domain-containing protein [Nitratireductor sp.]
MINHLLRPLFLCNFAADCPVWENRAVTCPPTVNGSGQTGFVEGGISTGPARDKLSAACVPTGEVDLADNSAQNRAEHWRKTRNLTILILVLWVLFAIIIPYSAAALNSMSFLGFPLGYWFCVQGSLIAFVLMIWFQNWRQDAIDDEHGVSE